MAGSGSARWIAAAFFALVAVCDAPSRPAPPGTKAEAPAVAPAGTCAR